MYIISAFTLGHIKHALTRSQDEGLLSSKTDEQVAYALRLIELEEKKALPSASEMRFLDGFAEQCVKLGCD